MGLMNQETVKDFSDNPADLKMICEEFDCNEYNQIYTQEMMLLLADRFDEIKGAIRSIDTEELEEE